jgi:hypothetical protein
LSGTPFVIAPAGMAGPSAAMKAAIAPTMAKRLNMNNPPENGVGGRNRALVDLQHLAQPSGSRH